MVGAHLLHAQDLLRELEASTQFASTSLEGSMPQVVFIEQAEASKPWPYFTQSKWLVGGRVSAIKCPAFEQLTIRQLASEVLLMT